MRTELLGNLVRISKGKKHEPSLSGTRYIQIEDLRHCDNIKYTSATKGTEVDYEDLVIVWDGAYSGLVSYGLKGFIGSTLARLRLVDPNKVYTPYLGHFIKTKFDYLQSQCTGATIPHVSKYSLESIKVILPSLPEQKRIAAILDKADAIRRKREKAIELTDSFLQAVFLEMFWSNPERNSWKECLIQDLVESTKGSMRTGPFGSALRHDEFTTSGIAVLGIDNAVNNRFTWGERRFISPEKYESLKRYTVQPGDVIITIMGTTGRSAVVPLDIPTAISTKHLATLTLNRQIADPDFVAFMIHSHPGILRQIKNANRGAIMDGLNLGIIRNLSLELPPLPLQKRFSQILERTRILRDKQVCEFLISGFSPLTSALGSTLFRTGQTSLVGISMEEVAHAL